MKLEEAIIRQQRLFALSPKKRYPLSLESTQLGIEALKWRKSQKDAGYLDEDDLLPGETKD